MLSNAVIGGRPLAPADLSNPEQVRIKEAYARRESRSVKQIYSYFDRGNLFIIQERERWILALLERYGRSALHAQKILEIGCGTGYWLREFVKWGARPQNIFGIDLLPERITEARLLCPCAVTLECGDATSLSYPEATFDLVLQSTVFSSILDGEMKRRIARQMLRLLKPDGIILWYDLKYNNPRNPDVRGIEANEIRSLFPNCKVLLRRVTLYPALARALAPRAWWLCSILSVLRFFNTHYLALICREE